MTFWRSIAGAEAALLLIGAWALWRLCDVVAAMRRKLTDQAVTLRLYRETRDHADAQIRELLNQNERLARHLIDAKAAQMSSALVNPRTPAILEALLYPRVQA